jgi:D-sedoheptulose 7-phosphate isomerase
MFSSALKCRKELLNIIGNSFDDDVLNTIKLVSETVKSGQFLFFAGNGGSAAEAQHMSAEYVATLDHRNYRKGIKALALTVDTSFLTAWTNDFEYETIFSRQLETLGTPNDLFFAYSTSGNSKNIIKAIEYASKNKI